MTPDATADSPGEASKQIPSTAGMTTKVVKGSMWTLAGQVAPLAVSLVTTPFVIRMLGAEGYGVFILIGLIPTYLGFADFGMSMASTKFASEAYAEGDEDREARIVRTAALVALMSSVPVAVALMIFAGVIIDLFNVPPAYIPEATLALRLAAVTFVINILCSIFNTPQLARLRMDLNTLINTIPRLAGLIATPLVIFLGFGVVGAVLVLLVASVLTLAGHLAVSTRLVRSLLGTAIDIQSKARMLKFGKSLAFSSIAALLLINVEKLILPATVSVTALAYYSVAFTLASLMTLLTSAMSQSLLPAFSVLQADRTGDSLNKLFSRSLRISIVWAVPALVVLALSAKPLLRIWVGDDFARESAIPFYILLLGIAFNIVAYLPHTAVMAFGRTDLFAKLYWIELVPYVFCAWLLTNLFGIVGTASAWSARVVVNAAIHFHLARKVAGVSIPVSMLPAFTVAIVIMCMPLIAFSFAEELTPPVVVVTAVCAGLYLIVVWKMVMVSDEVAWVVGLLKRVRMRP